MWREKGEKIVKLECRIVQPQRKPKPGKYPNDINPELKYHDEQHSND